MPAKHSRHIALTGPLEQWAEGQVAHGELTSVSDLIRTAIRLLRERDEARIERRPVAAPITPSGNGQD